jgi:hypothetical protein
MAHAELDFETAYVTGGSVVQSDQGLSASHETKNAVGVREYRPNIDDTTNHFDLHSSGRIVHVA